MRAPAGYRLRAAAPGDLEAAAAVLAADDLDDAGEVVLDSGFLQEQWDRPGFRLATDTWVAVDGAGALVAYGQATRDEPGVAGSWGVVHPAHRGRGIGSALLDRIVERAPALVAPDAPAPRFRHAVNAGDAAAAAMLGARGLRLVRHFWHMRADLPASGGAGASASSGSSQWWPHPRVPPEGVAVTGLRSPEDLRRVHAVLDVAFADHWGHSPEPFDRWAEDNISGPSHDPGLWRLAWREGRLAGAVIAVVLEGRGWVTLLGVERASRGRGVATLLLSEAFAALEQRGVERVYLAVDAENPTGATALYERAGMRVVKRWDLWERPLTARAG